jgi:hypothetical protein
LVGEGPGRDLVGLKISNTDNVQDNVIGISLRRCDQLKPDVIWDLLGKVIQNNSRFGLTGRFEVHLDHVRIPAANGGVKTKGRSLDMLSAIKKIIVVVKTYFLCFAHALVIAEDRVNGDPQYTSYRDGYLLDQPVEGLLKASGVDLSNGGVWRNFNSFKITFQTTKLFFMTD